MENTNSVAFIAKIENLNSIEKADKIEQALCKGWSSVVQKDIHKIGDLVLCITNDAVIPQELAEKWGVDQYLRKGNRVRTVKLKSTISECILIPLDDIIPLTSDLLRYHSKESFEEGMDLMKYLNIHKYEPPLVEEQLPNGKKIRFSQNPNFHIYHKFPNAKNVPNMFNDGDIVEVTRKIHGTNARYGIVKKNKLGIIGWIKKLFGDKWGGYEYVYGSHNVQKSDDSNGYYASNVWKEIDRKYNIKKILWNYVKSDYYPNITNFIIYGEIYGPGIQGEKYDYDLKEKEFAGIDVEVNNTYVSTIKKENIFEDLPLPKVESLYCGPYKKELLTMFNEDKMINGLPHEGVVISSITGDRTKIMKVISPNYTMAAEKYSIPDSH